MSARVRKHADVLQVLAKAKPTLCKTIIQGADQNLMRCLCECTHNILKGNVPLSPPQKAKLTRYKKELRAVAKKTTSQKRKKQALQKGGFLPALMAPLLAPLATKLLGKIFK